MKKPWDWILSLLILICIWYILSAIFQTQTIPFPHEVALTARIPLLLRIGEHLGVSLFRVLLGMLLVLLLGAPVGIFMGVSPSFNRFFQGFVHILYPIPKVAFLPLVLIVFGIGGQSAVVMVMLILYFQVVVQTRDSVRTVTREQLNGVQALGAKKHHILFHVVFYSVLPGIFTWLRLGLGTALAVLFFTENIASDVGIGFFILDSWSRIAYKEMALAIVILSLAGMILFYVIGWMEKKILRWNPKIFD